MMNIVQNVINMYKTDPIKFFMMIAIIYLVLRSFNVIESFRPSNVATDIDLQALSTASQLAQTWQKAFDIDATGNVTFKKNVTNNGTLLNKGIVTINSDLNQNIGGTVKAQLHDGRILGNYAIFGPTTGSSQDTKFTIHSNGNIESKGEIKGNTMNFANNKIRSNPEGKMKVFNNFEVFHPTIKSYMSFYPGNGDAFRVMYDHQNGSGRYFTLNHNGAYYTDHRRFTLDKNSWDM